MKLISLSTLSLALALSFTACKNSDNSSSSAEDSTKTEKGPKSGLKAEIKVLKDSVDFFWNGIQTMSKGKYKDMNRLLDEISYTDKPNTLELTKCRERLKEVSAMSLDPHTMTVEQIVAMDNAEDSLITRCITLAAQTPGIESHTIVNTLIDDINNANGTTLISFRGKYDHYVQDFNAILADKSKKLDKMGAPYDSYRPYKTFSGK